MNKLRTIASVITFSLFASLSPAPQKGICIVPVADLLSQKVIPQAGQSVLDCYQAIPLSENPPLKLCTRVTQLLYNQEVTILGKEKGQLYIETPYWHLKKPTSSCPSSKNDRFWTLASNIKPLSALTQEEQTTIPDPVRSHSKRPTIILKNPFECPQTGLTYSVGTRFVITQEDDAAYTVSLYDLTEKEMVTCNIPASLCIKEVPLSPKEKRTLFVKMIREWAHPHNGFIPYVLGGTSIGKLPADDRFIEKKVGNFFLPSIIHKRPTYTDYPYNGVDCIGLIRLASLVSGTPLYATNSTSLSSILQKLPAGSLPENGDLVYWKGHMAIISDVDKGLLIEARGYNHGYGIVQEIPYQEQFHLIHTTDDLVKASHKHSLLGRFDKRGIKRETVHNLTIYKLPIE